MLDDTMSRNPASEPEVVASVVALEYRRPYCPWDASGVLLYVCGRHSEGFRSVTWRKSVSNASVKRTLCALIVVVKPQLHDSAAAASTGRHETKMHESNSIFNDSQRTTDGLSVYGYIWTVSLREALHKTLTAVGCVIAQVSREELAIRLVL